MDEATWARIADENHLPEGERDHILAAANTRIEHHPAQAAGRDRYQLAADLIRQKSSRPVTREEHVLPDRHVWPGQAKNLAWRSSPDSRR